MNEFCLLMKERVLGFEPKAQSRFQMLAPESAIYGKDPFVKGTILTH